MHDDSTVIRLVFTVDDIRSMAEGLGVDADLAIERATDWASAISGTANELITDQLMGVVRDDQP